MVKCGDCENLKAYFTASTYCEGNPEKAVHEGLCGNQLLIEFSHYECTEEPDYRIDQDIEKEREWEDYKRDN